MTKAKPQLSKENETREPFVLYGVGLGRIKSRIARLRVAIEGRFLIRLSKLFNCEDTARKKNCDNVLKGKLQVFF